MARHKRHRRSAHWTPLRLLVVLGVLLFVVWALTTAHAHEPPDKIAPAPVVQAPPVGWSTDADLLRIVDGDTLDVSICLVVRVRLIDCWAPETRTLDLNEKRRGQAAKLYLQNLVDERRVRVHIPGRRRLSDMLTMDRVLGRVWLIDNGAPAARDLSTMMIAAGHATRVKEESTQ